MSLDGNLLVLFVMLRCTILYYTVRILSTIHTMGKNIVPVLAVLLCCTVYCVCRCVKDIYLSIYIYIQRERESKSERDHHVCTF